MNLLDPIQVSVVESSTRASSGPLYGDGNDHARAFEVGLNGTILHPDDRRVVVDLIAIVYALTGEHPWPEIAWQMLRARADELTGPRLAERNIALTEANVPTVVDIVVQVVREVLGPARDVGARYAPVAVLLGPRLRLLSARHGAIVAEWQHGPQTSAPVNQDVQALVAALVPRWSAPHIVQHEDGRTWDSAALRVRETVAWHELSNRELLEIAAFESWREQYFRAASAQFLRSMMITSSRRDLGFALAEAAYRDLLPTPDDLRIACDLAETQGVLTPENITRWTLVELWARCMPRLWALRGDRTL